MIALPPPRAPLARRLPFFAPAWVQDAWPRAAQSPLTPCLLLALLLHVWLVLMLGTAPPGTALPGQGVWGALNVTLRGPAQAGPVADLAPPPLPPAGLPGNATSPRVGGTVRAPAAPPWPEPGAARRGDWAATPAPEPAPAAEPEPVRRPPPTAGLQSPLPEPTSAAAERRLGAEPGLSATAARAEPLERVVALPPVAARLPLPQALPAVPVPPMPAPVPAPVVATPAPPAIAVAPAVPADPVPAAPALRQVAPMTAAAAPAAAIAPVQAPAAQAPLGLPTLVAPPAGVPLPLLPAGRPDAGPLVGHDVATAPSAPASAPRLNLELARPRGGELSRQAGGGVLPLLPRPPELPDKLARDIDQAAKPDCRKAYQGLGVLAVVPLAANALRGAKDSGCRW